MEDFFDLHIPASNEGFGMFSAGHICWLAAGLVFCVLMGKAYRKSADRRKMRVAVACVTLFLELLRAALELAAGEYSLYTLPLHLCGMAVYLEFIHALTDNGRLGQFLYAFCFPGAVFALVFPDWDYFPLFNILTFLGFTLHILIVCYTVMQLCDIKPSLRSAPSNLLIMLALAVPVYIFDKLLNTNYMFLNWPVVPLTLFSALGRPGYLLGYLPILAVTWLVIYLPLKLIKEN